MRRRPILTIILIALVVLVVYRIITSTKREVVKDLDALQEELGVPVDVQTVVRSGIRVWKEYAGEVEGVIQTELSSDFPERVLRLPNREGDLVQKGGTVIELEEDSPTSQYMQAVAAYENAKREYERLQPLYGKGAISERELDAAKTAVRLAEANLKTSKSTVRLTSPVPGVLTYVGVTEGELVTPGKVLATVAKIDTARIVFHVVQEDAMVIEDGTRAEVRPAGEGGRVLEGEVTSVSLSPDPVTRLFRVEALVSNRDYLLRPDTLVPVRVVLDERADVLAIPKDAVVGGSLNPSVFVVENGVGRVREVSLGLEAEEEIEVREGLADGEVVVVWGQNRLTDGARVKVREHRGGM
jgi:RND family efflux transporter MFP subunit